MVRVGRSNVNKHIFSLIKAEQKKKIVYNMAVRKFEFCGTCCLERAGWITIAQGESAYQGIQPNGKVYFSFKSSKLQTL